jgi:hypothetical protein
MPLINATYQSRPILLIDASKYKGLSFSRRHGEAMFSDCRAPESVFFTDRPVIFPDEGLPASE